jgi:hypothetical protein
MTVKKMLLQVIKEAKHVDYWNKWQIFNSSKTPYQIPPDSNNKYQRQLSSPANSYSTSTSSQQLFPFIYGDESNA